MTSPRRKVSFPCRDHTGQGIRREGTQKSCSHVMKARTEKLDIVFRVILYGRGKASAELFNRLASPLILLDLPNQPSPSRRSVRPLGTSAILRKDRSCLPTKVQVSRIVISLWSIHCTLLSSSFTSALISFISSLSSTRTASRAVRRERVIVHHDAGQ